MSSRDQKDTTKIDHSFAQSRQRIERRTRSEYRHNIRPCLAENSPSTGQPLKTSGVAMCIRRAALHRSENLILLAARKVRLPPLAIDTLSPDSFSGWSVTLDPAILDPLDPQWLKSWVS
jgi:hypothetical protein